VRSLNVDIGTSDAFSTCSTACQNNSTGDNSPWDDVGHDVAANAAAAAIRNVGGNSKTTTAIAEALKRTTTSNERRRRREAAFQSTGAEAGDKQRSNLKPPESEQLSRSNTSERRLRMAARFASE